MNERDQPEELAGRMKRVTLCGHELIEFCHRVGVIVCSVTVGKSPAMWEVVYVDLTVKDFEEKAGQREMSS